SVINGDLGLHPGTAVTGFPPGTVNGAQHVTDAVAQQAKTDLVTAYNDAAGRPNTATLPPDAGGQTLTAGVYRTGSVPSLGLTGNLTLDAQGNQSAVFIFQIESTLTTASASSVSLINGAQACNVYWQVGSSATLGTTTVFRGNILALQSISVNNGVAVDGRLLARNGALTLINDTVTRSQCAAGTGVAPGAAPGAAPGSPGPDVTGPVVRITGPPSAGVCTTRNFTASVRLSDNAGISSVSVFLDGRRVRRTSLTRFSLRIAVRGLRVGTHRIRVVALDRAGNQSVRTRSFRRCALALPAPRFTG
ncbi:MAG: ice-binding family protein, partial [Actinomycetota bacterium]|nr:ice-binding family protein [Actinomycetota bacterium]